MNYCYFYRSRIGAVFVWKEGNHMKQYTAEELVEIDVAGYAALEAEEIDEEGTVNEDE